LTFTRTVRRRKPLPIRTFGDQVSQVSSGVCEICGEPVYDYKVGAGNRLFKGTRKTCVNGCTLQDYPQYSPYRRGRD